MTETAGLITVLDKKKYFSGMRGVGRVMDGVEMQLCELNRIKLNAIVLDMMRRECLWG